MKPTKALLSAINDLARQQATPVEPMLIVHENMYDFLLNLSFISENTDNAQSYLYIDKDKISDEDGKKLKNDFH